MYKTILLPVSGNGLVRAKEALRHVMGIADASATIVLLHIFDPIALTVGGDARAQLLAEAVAEGENILNAVTPELKKCGIPFRCRVEEGTVAETIIRIAHDEQADLIVMATDGRDGLPDFLLGSITERVLRNTDMPLLAIRLRQGK